MELVDLAATFIVKAIVSEYSAYAKELVDTLVEALLSKGIKERKVELAAL